MELLGILQVNLGPLGEIVSGLNASCYFCTMAWHTVCDKEKNLE